MSGNAPTRQAAGLPASGPITPGQPAARPAGGKETIEQLLARAQAAAQGKRLNEAAGICADVLEASPEHPAALALQGIVTGLGGDPDKGIGLLRLAIKRHPT